jgi:hypothetical protein
VSLQKNVNTDALEVGFVILVIGAVLLPVSQIPLATQHYDLIDTRYFSEGQPMEFHWTFKENKSYRFEVKGANWPSPPSSLHQFAVGNGTYLGSSEPALAQPPWAWYEHPRKTTITLKVTFWEFGAQEAHIIELANTGTYVDIFELKQTTTQPTYLVYVSASLIVIGAAVAVIIGWMYPPTKPQEDWSNVCD